MPYFDQEDFDIRCEWGIAGVRNIAPADVIVIVDVLSFSTAVDVGVSRGVRIFPYRWKDESAAKYADDCSAELATSRNQVDGKYSLSPSSLINAPAGLRLVLPSPNGSNLAFEAMASGAVVIAGCLRSAEAVAKRAQQLGQRITVVPAGERWPDGSLRPAIEDQIGAGAIIAQLRGRCSPEAEAAIAVFDRMHANLHETLRASSSGRELVERGFLSDIELAGELNVSKTVPVLKDNAFADYGNEKDSDL